MFNSAGVPLMAYGKSYFAVTTGMPAAPKKSITKEVDKLEEDLTLGGMKLAPWGTANDFPGASDILINKTGALNTGLRYIRNYTIGQGIFPVRVNGFDDDGNEILEVIDDAKIRNFLGSRMVRRYMSNTLRDFLKFGQAFPELIPNEQGNQIVGINTVNALHCRLSAANKGIIENCVISGEWPDSPSEGKYSTRRVLDLYDPYEDLMSLKLMKKLSGKSFIYLVRDEWSNADYYPVPAWYSAYKSGWIEIANSVPVFLKKAYQNQASWMWHVKIPYSYWDKMFPQDQYKDEATRRSAIKAEMDTIENNITGVDNANKVIFTHFEIGMNGKPEEQWIIEPLQNKNVEGDKLFTSAAANSEILFALMINPNVMGAGMPGGTYAGNQGGSNIREAFLVNIANAWLDRQALLDPLECMLEFNGVKDIELRFRNTILTTLDTGAGTTKKLS